MDNFQKALLATFVDYTETGLNEPDLNEIEIDIIFGLGLLPGEAIFPCGDSKIVSRNLISDSAKNKSFQETQTLIETDLKLDLISKAVELANQAFDIDTLENSIKSFSGFHARKGSSGMALASGNPNSNVMIVSEPPSRAEELVSVPYTGLAGELFTKIFAALGLSIDGEKESGMYVLPAFPFRLVKGFNTQESDLNLIRPFVKRYINMVSPRYLVLIGKIPSLILGLTDQFLSNKEHGQIGYYNEIPAIEIEGINSMIKFPERKRRTWNNLKLLKELIREGENFGN